MDGYFRHAAATKSLKMLGFSWFIFYQIVLESFPISSSGHLALLLSFVSDWNSFQYRTIVSLLDRSDIMFALHGPTAIVIALYYAPRWIPFFSSLVRFKRTFCNIVAYVFSANCVTAAFYFGMKWADLSIPLWLGFLITFCAMMAIPLMQPRPIRLQLWHFILLGAVQEVAILPGISRLATVYATGRLFGLTGKKAFDTAWLLQFPLITAAAFFGWAQLIVHHETDLLLSSQQGVALICGSLFALCGLYMMDWLARREMLWLMGWYMVIPFLFSVRFMI